MLQSFSWGDYFTLISFLTITYYSSILLLYYRKELNDVFKKVFARYRMVRYKNEKTINGATFEVNGLQDKLVPNFKTEYTAVEPVIDFESDQQSSQPDPFHNKQAGPDKLALFSYVHELMDEIGQVLKTAASKKYIKEELITALQIKVSQYPMLEGTDFKSTISGFIVTESRKACSVFLSEDELERLWKKGR